MENIKLLVAMHKAYCLPEDAVYAPIQVGGVHIPGMENALRDDTGENISNKNRSYCELTALYWGWKNLQADYLGLVHYRRYFARRMPGGRKFDRIASGTEIHAALEKAPVILPKKRNYWIETTYTQYIHAHHKEDLDAVQSILAEKYAAYLPAYAAVMGRTSGQWSCLRFSGRAAAGRLDGNEPYCVYGTARGVFGKSALAQKGHRISQP